MAALGSAETVESPGRGSVDLLPKWDSYTMGYAPDERRRFVHPEAQTRVYNEPGHGLGVVLVEGAAAGAWGMRFAGGTGRMLVDLDLFERPGAKLRRAIDERFEEAAALLSARSVSFGYTCGIGAARYRSLPKPA